MCVSAVQLPIKDLSGKPIKKTTSGKGQKASPSFRGSPVRLMQGGWAGSGLLVLDPDKDITYSGSNYRSESRS